MTVMALAMAAGFPGPAQAAAPLNDGPGQAESAGIGFSDVVNVSQATAGRGDPSGCSNNASVWYKFTPSRTREVNVNTVGSNYDTVLGVYTGKPGSLTEVTCRNDRFRRQVALDLEVTAGTTYRFMIGACCGNGRDGQSFAQQPLRLEFHVTTPLRLQRAAVADTGIVSRTVGGDARVTLSSQCNHLARGGWLEATLQQRVGEIFVARGSTFSRTSCGTAPTDMTLTFSPEGDVAFGEGPATVSLHLAMCSQETGTCTRRRINQEVVLAFPLPVTAR